MGLRADFLEHKNKTIESFNLVSSDISTLNLNLVNLRTILVSIEEKISELGVKVNEVNQSLRADIEIQNSTNASMASKIVEMNSFVNSRISNFEREIGKIDQKVEGKVKDSIDEFDLRINDAESRFGRKAAAYDIKLKKFSARNRKISKKVTASSNSLKKLVPISKSQSATTRKIGSSLREMKEEVRKLKNFLNRKVSSVRRADEEIEARVKSQRRRMQQLNRKIESVSTGKTARRALKRLGRRPARKISRAARKTITKKITPKTKKVYEVIREKKPLI